MESLEAINELLKKYGTGAAGWIVLFGLMAWVAGKGGKAAVANVKSMLDLSKELSERLSEQLESSAKQLDRANEIIQDLRAREVEMIERHRQEVARYEKQIQLQNRRMMQLEARIAQIEGNDHD